jgi:hypothetical protein
LNLSETKKTGILEVWKDGKYVGNIITMGDEINGKSDIRNDKLQR